MATDTKNMSRLEDLLPTAAGHLAWKIARTFGQDSHMSAGTQLKRTKSRLAQQ